MSWAATATAAGSIIGSALGKQKAPKVAPIKEVDIKKTTQDAMDANIAVFDDSRSLSEKTNTFNQSEANRLAELAMPGFAKLQASLTSRIQQDLNNEGQLDRDQIAQIERLAAERGITTGTSGGMRDLSLIRDFGFSAMDAKNADRMRALQGIQSLTGMSARVSPTSPMYAFVNPNSALEASFRNAENQQQVTQAGYNAQAAASNANRSMWGRTVGTVSGISADFLSNRPAGVQSRVLNQASPSAQSNSQYGGYV